MLGCGQGDDVCFFTRTRVSEREQKKEEAEEGEGLKRNDGKGYVFIVFLGCFVLFCSCFVFSVLLLRFCFVLCACLKLCLF
jgi:hypothetical protein